MEKREIYRSSSDLDKIQSQWNKMSKLHDRDEWAAVIVRAATTAEIATNFAIRKEFAARSTFAVDFVDSLMLWANGIDGKLNRLLIPLCKGIKAKERTLMDLKPRAARISKDRNAIVHRGEFRNKKESIDAIADIKAFVEGLVSLYEPEFELGKKKK